MTRASLDSPIGPLTLVGDGARIVALKSGRVEGEGLPLLDGACAQLCAHFDHRLVAFDLALDRGTGLHAAVRRATAAIPPGETPSHGHIARDPAHRRRQRGRPAGRTRCRS